MSRHLTISRWAFYAGLLTMLGGAALAGLEALPDALPACLTLIGALFAALARFRYASAHRSALGTNPFIAPQTQSILPHRTTTSARRVA